VLFRSGTVVLDVGELCFHDLHHYVERTFRPVAESKHVNFLIHLDARLPKSMITDAKRFQQILKNLLSNAFKFTHRGQVTLTIEASWNPEQDGLNRVHEVIAFSVSDTGIGISTDKQQIIFEAFQQADGSTSRKYGGTGLGLAISRELSRLLGGEIRLVSNPGQGSTFTLYLPQIYAPARTGRSRPALAPTAPVQTAQAQAEVLVNNGAQMALLPGAVRASPSVPAVAPLDPEPVLLVNEAGDDRDRIRPGDAVLLIVENDLGFARLLLDAAREKGFKGLVTSLGAGALALTREYEPTLITLDIFLPDMEGWRVLDRLKHDLYARHIPVCVISTDEARERALNAGAFGFVGKPVPSKDRLDQALDSLKGFVGRAVKNLLVVMPGSDERADLLQHVGGDDVGITTVADGQAALQILQQQHIDCLVLDLRITTLEPAAVAEATVQVPTLGRLPVILYGNGRQVLNDSPWREVKDFTVREARSTARLLDQIAFFLHRNTAHMTGDRRRLIEDLHESHKVLSGKRVLIVDDDMRNIFALTTVLDEHEPVILSADNGLEAIRIVEANPAIDIVLMDIMMPEMDGITTIQEIRKIPACRDLPIIAVTAKAMKGDRERCIEAGAWDYLSKPVDPMHLLSTLRAWLYR
jgi:CheY-like chemotaxis protein/two-component sensor histidine kinase